MFPCIRSPAESASALSHSAPALCLFRAEQEREETNSSKSAATKERQRAMVAAEDKKAREMGRKGRGKCKNLRNQEDRKLPGVWGLEQGKVGDFFPLHSGAKFVIRKTSSPCADG